MGTCTFCAPSTRIFVELGNAVEKSDMPLSLHPPTHGEGESGSKGLLSIPDGIPLAVKVRLYQGQRAKGKGQRRAEGTRGSAQEQEASAAGLRKTCDRVAERRARDDADIGAQVPVEARRVDLSPL